ncbi:MAG: T9SS type A sorting domain-containing protein [Bacteroidales bacterium]|nr:T9SS type A sorting domain-containing protein [Bacteroidales bacterium]MCF8457057.1 T9SS type A sorting domain-containing protein [Bacteroidales bacterium]
MKNFTKAMMIFTLTIIFGISAIAQSGNKPMPNPSESDDAGMSVNPEYHATPVNHLKAWNLQFNYPTAPNHPSQAGIETDGTYFYVAQWNSDSIFKYDMSGNYVGFFKIAGVTGLRDLAFDGTYFYGSNATVAAIWEMDFTTQTLVSTISVPSGIAIRHIAYDDLNDAFWVGNWATDLKLISRTGAVLNTIPAATHGLESIYGTAFDSITPGGPYLWAISASSVVGEIYMLNIATGQQTGIVWNVPPDLGLSDGLGGGLFTHFDIVTGEYTLGGLIQGEAIFGYNLEQIISANDLGIAAVSSPATGLNLSASEPVSCTIMNYGFNTASNFILSYTINGGTPVTEIYLMSLPFGQTANFTFVTTADLSTAGTYEICVYTQLAGDADISNDEACTTVYALANSATKLVLVEHFTQASCAPCASQNPALDALITSAANIDKVVHIAYHTHWPGNDPMFDFNDSNGEGDARVDYYDVSGVPNCVIAGNQDQGLPSIVTQTAINTEYARPGMFNITGTAIVDMSTNIMDVNIDFEAYASFPNGAIKGHIVFVEEVNYTSPPGSNGEIYFPDVMRKMFPSQDGTDLNNPGLGDIVPVNFTYTIQSPINAYNTKLICFVQNDMDKEIYMATMIEVQVINSMEEISADKVNIYPNPSVGFFKITNVPNSSITVYNTLGEVVTELSNANRNAVIDLSGYANGAYFVRIVNDNDVITKMIQLSR